MIGSLGVPELLFILVLALLIFGPRKLPEIGRTLGRALGEFRRATSDLKRTLDAEMSSEEVRASPPVAVQPEPAQPEPVQPEPAGTLSASGGAPEATGATDADPEAAADSQKETP